MERKGIYTTEFWIAAAVNIVTAVVGILALRGLLTAQEGNLYIALASAIIAGIAPLVIAFVTGRYINARAVVKAANGRRPTA